MTVYVDSMYARYGRMIMCHMIADDLDELHKMAEKIGLKREWFQGDHYDVSKTRRAAAVELGAEEITCKKAAMMVSCWKKLGWMPRPENAKMIWSELRKEARDGQTDSRG